MEAERLAIEAAQSDPNRFADLYEDNFDRVYAYIARRVRSREEAEDLTSEVFHKALSTIAQFEWRGVPFAAWLYRIAANSIIDRGKRAAKEQALPVFTDVAVSVSAIEHEFDVRARLYNLVARLPTDQGRVVVARFAEEKSIREIALEMGRSEGAVKQLQFRALENLRASLVNTSSGEAHG